MRESFDQAGYKDIEAYGDLFAAQLPSAPNTYVWGKDPHIFTPTPLNVPYDIWKRIRLNTLRLNGLATHIFPPSVRPTRDDLVGVQNLANQTNEQIGLPPTNDLVIRTRKIVPKSESKKLYTPMLLSIDGGKKYKLFGEGQPPINSLDEFYAMLPRDMFLMVHDDNKNAQEAAIHGNFAYFHKDQAWHLLLGRGMLHARNLEKMCKDGEEAKDHILYLCRQAGDCFPKTVVSTGLGGDLLYRASELWDKVEFAYSKVQQEFGDDLVMEFRNYRLGKADEIQVLDVMNKV